MKLKMITAVMLGFLTTSSVFALQSTDLQVIPNAYYYAKYDGKDAVYIRDGENKDMLTFFDYTKLFYPSQQEIDYNKLDLGGLLVTGEGKAPVVQFTTYEGDKNSLKFKTKDGTFMAFATCTNPGSPSNICQLITYQYQLGDNGRIKGGGGGSLLLTKGPGSYNILTRNGNYLLVQQLIGKNVTYSCPTEKDTKCILNAGGKLSENYNLYIVNPVTLKSMYLGKGIAVESVKINGDKKTVQFKKYLKSTKGDYQLGKQLTRRIP